MLCRVSCESCRVSPIWTDDPASFVHAVCRRPRACRARLVDEASPLSPGAKHEDDVRDAVVSCLSS
jgi:hypothetical protein